MAAISVAAAVIPACPLESVQKTILQPNEGSAFQYRKISGDSFENRTGNRRTEQCAAKFFCFAIESIKVFQRVKRRLARIPKFGCIVLFYMV